MTSPSKERPVAGQVERAEEELWRRVTEDVRRLAGRGRVAESACGGKAEEVASPSQENAARRKQSGGGQTPAAPCLPELRPGEMPGVDRRTAERLRRGLLPVGARLDLHGLTREQARVALNAFIAKSAKQGKRCLLVITGKGTRAGVEEGWRGEGVLRDAVPRWLNESPNRDKILAISHAQPKDGGDGALYVLLKRRRRG